MARKSKPVAQLKPAPDPAWEAWSKECDQRAARVCLEATLPLIGVDAPPYGILAEYLSLSGAQKRFDCIRGWMQFHGLPETAARSLVLGEGQFGSDRMLAAWWYCVRENLFWDHKTILMIPKTGPYLEIAESGVGILTDLDRSVHELIEVGRMRSDARELIIGHVDQKLRERAGYRSELAEFNQKLKEIGG